MGNEGPTHPVAHPAAYDSVVAVTATDRTGRVFPGAQRGSQVMFAAVGQDLPAAAGPYRLGVVSGTSFAVPEVAGRLLRLHRRRDAPSLRAVLEILRAGALDLGEPDRDPVYGYGWVSFGGGMNAPARLSARD